MKARVPGTTVLLSAAPEAPSIAEALAVGHRPVVRYDSLDVLLREQPLSSISVLVLHFPRPPKGVLLSVVARMALEYPGMQTIAVFEGPPSLQHAGYLTACGVELIWAERRKAELGRLAAAVNGMRERSPWMTQVAG